MLWLERLSPRRAALLLWVVACAVLLATHWASLPGLRTVDPDDALRLVQVRDLMSGQGWWDVSQHRINPAGGGGLMHWSRIVDTPIALGIALLSPVIGTALAEIIMAACVPLLLLGALFWAAARTYSATGQNRLAALAVALMATDYVILFQFAPLRIDHHGWQILLSLLMLGAVVMPASARQGILAGVAGAALVAISLEGLPMIALMGAIMAIAWAWTGDAACRRRLLAYLVCLAGMAMLLQVATRGPDAVLQRWCDSLSLPYLAALVVAALAVSAGIAMLGRMRGGPLDRVRFRSNQNRGPVPLSSAISESFGVSTSLEITLTRFAVLGAAGVAAAAALLAVAPVCAAGPFAALDPVVVRYWYVNVHEGLPIWTDISPMFAFALMPMLVGLAGTWCAWRRADDAAQRRVWLTLMAAVSGTSLLALFVLRTASVAHVFAMPGCAWLILHGWVWARNLAAAPVRIVATLAVLTLIPPFAGSAVGFWLREAAPPADAGASALNAETCVDAAGAAALNRLPPATIMAPLDIGPHLLQRTHHSVTATGHHRNNRVMAQTIMAYIGDPADAPARAGMMHASLIVICPRANETGNFQLADGDGLADLLMTGRAPDWLEPVVLPAGSNLRAWRIR